MSSKYLTILLAVAALLLCAGCSSEDVENILAGGRVSAQVTASINNGKSVTRISTTDNTPAFADNDVIHVVANATSSHDYTYSGSAWTSTSPYYFETTDAVSFKGWYSTTAASNNSITIDTKTQTLTSGWNNWDILTTPAVSTTVGNPTVNFTSDGTTDNRFSHIMSKVTFKFHAGDGITDLKALSSYTITDIITEATFNALTCELTPATTTDDVTITATGTEDATSVECDPIILIPQTLTDNTLTIDITYNSQVYTVPLTLASLDAGTHYTINVDVNNSELLATATIESWNEKTITGSADKLIYTTDEETGERTYTVSDLTDLVQWANYVNGKTDGKQHLHTNFTLANDITLTDEWTSVIYGYRATGYEGTFDGGGHTISGVVMNYEENEGNDDYQGFIGYLGDSGVVKNLILENIQVTSSQGTTGALVGYNDGGTITNCHVINGTVAGKSGKERVGGLVGRNKGVITGCSFSGTVTGYDNATGGVVGYNDKGNVVACYATGTVTGTDYVGGVIGHNRNSGIVIASYSTAAVSSSSSATTIGGVVGYNESGCTVTNCYWSNSTTDNGIGSNSGTDGTTKVDGSTVTWSDSSGTTVALSSMNTTLASGYTNTSGKTVTCDWRYVANSSYDGSDTSIAPLLLEDSSSTATE